MTAGMPSGGARSGRAHTCFRHDGGMTVNGVRIDPVDRARFLETVDSFLSCGLSHVVHFLPADPIVRAMDDRRYREALNAGELNVPDGKSVVWALRLKSGYRSNRLAGPDAMELLVRKGEQHRFRHFLFGGEPAVLTALRNRLQLRYPRIELAGTESPPFRALEAWELEEAAARIGAVNTQLLWIGLGTPKQDLVADTLRDLSAAPVILCVGAAFDFLAGAKRRAPKWMQQAGLEWLHRLGSEPGRLGRRYLVGNPRFMWGVARELLSRRHG